MSGQGPCALDSRTPGRKISVVDAVCCVCFCAAGKSPLLVSILTTLGMEILIPEEVAAEAESKRSYGQLATHMRRLRASTKVTILPRLMLGDERSAVLANVARVRGLGVGLTLSRRKDLGEAIAIGHARCKELGVSRQTLYRQRLARRRSSAGWRAGVRPKVRGPKRPQTLSRGPCDHHS